MNSFIKGGRARRVPGTARRRAVEFKPTLAEELEARRLLAAGSLGLNVDISPFTSFVNWLQVPGNWGPNPGQSNTITLNSSNDPTSDATVVFDLRVNQSFNGPDPNAVQPNINGTYSLSFKGQATIEPEYPGFSTQFTVENQVYNPLTNTTTASLVVPSSNWSDFFGITFANTQATSNSGLNTGFSNAVLIRPGYAANSTQLYTNEFLSALQPYSVLRYLDPDNANNQPYFNGNTLVTVNASQVDQTGVPWEYLVTLANETNTDMWINVPQGATDDYVTALADIIKNGGTVGGVTYAGLDSNLKVYVEYSNEVWGGIPNNEYYQTQAVQNSASNQPLSTFSGNTDIYDNPDGSTTTDVYTAMSRRYLERTAEIGQLFQSVFGADPTHQKIRPVLGWQEDNTSFYPPALTWFEHFFGPASSAFYGMGDANYFDATDYSSVDAAITSLQSQETTFAIPETIAFSTIATYYGLANVSYEGGPGLQGDPNTPQGQVALAASRDPRMEEIVYQHYIDFFEDGGELGNYFDGPFGILSGENNWDIAEDSQYGDPTASPRYNGTVDLENAAPVAVTAGTIVSSTSPTSFSASTDSTGASFSSATAGEQGYWLLNTATAGTFDLELATAASGSLGQVEVFLNDKQVGGAIDVMPSGSMDLGNLNLSKGLNTLSIVVVTGPITPTTFSLKPSKGLTDLAVGGTATTSSDNSANGEGVAQAFDQNAATKWLTFSNTGYIQYQFAGDQSQMAAEYSLTAGADTSVYPGRAPNDWSLLGSNNGTTWTTLDTEVNQADTTSGDTRTYTIADPGSYEYYRLNITANNGASITQLADLDLLGQLTPLTELAVGGTATTSSDNSAHGEGVAQAFDQNAATKWLTFSNIGYIQYQFAGGQSQMAAEYSLTAGADTSIYPGRAPNDWSLLGSNNGTTWTTLDTEVNQADTTSGDTRTYTIADPGFYEYYRLNITANNGASSTQLADLDLLGQLTSLTELAVGGTATTSSDNSAHGEGVAQAFDQNSATKWLTFSNTGYIQYQFSGGQSEVVTDYTLTAGADTSVYPGRAPNDWALLGSNDGVTWTTLDTEVNQADTTSGDTRTYEIADPGSYEYYRLNITANNGASSTQLADLGLLGPKAPLIDLAVGGTATTSSDNSANGEGVVQAFDQNSATKWLTFSNTGYIQYQFAGGQSEVVTEYSLTAGADTSVYPGRAPNDWTLLGSNNGTTWTTLDTEVNQADTTSGDTQTYLVSNPGAYQYYRLFISANNGASITQLAELQLLG